ncbi:hypothetical protein B9G98_04429 [Wickerhamiella sorbophila]|uniref:Uncharacterized protein n=1 Tax=Wickerhamiella sorbophila TaxID=45607 RepID=A0A2T0FPC2_9ASCO|nr:hypothetical protein B9G98_04429 [Wickerhamiella sorbophila]PRT56809.1 hypothetical protein B9G98_04429 [Wickerhamiella sorbophila]
MQPVAGADDLRALLEVLEQVHKETQEHRQKIDDTIEAADKFYQPEEDEDIASLEKQVDAERARNLATMVLLDTAIGYLGEATQHLRTFSRAEAVNTLEFYNKCSKELYKWQQKRQQAEYELLKLRQTEIDVAEKLSEVLEKLEHDM